MLRTSPVADSRGGKVSEDSFSRFMINLTVASMVDFRAGFSLRRTKKTFIPHRSFAVYSDVTNGILLLFILPYANARLPTTRTSTSCIAQTRSWLEPHAPMPSSRGKLRLFYMFHGSTRPAELLCAPLYSSTPPRFRLTTGRLSQPAKFVNYLYAHYISRGICGV